MPTNALQVIDASQSMEEISRQIQQLAVDTIDKVQHLPLRHDLFLN
jgi:hypothetical protein